MGPSRCNVGSRDRLRLGPACSRPSSAQSRLVRRCGDDAFPCVERLFAEYVRFLSSVSFPVCPIVKARLTKIHDAGPKEPLGDSLLFGDLVVAPSPARNASPSPAAVVAAAEEPRASSSAKTSKTNKMPPAPAMSVFSVKTAGGRKRSREPSTGDDGDDDDAALADKRRRNNAAAAKYRQKKLDRISELEEAVAKVSKERDELKLQLARRDEEIRILREMLMAKK